ncbi:MAG: polysaccharide export protein [Xanthomonadales bacterium]|nr:polysaccharide export protein [Xanthomonadales bacterium]
MKQKTIPRRFSRLCQPGLRAFAVLLVVLFSLPVTASEEAAVSVDASYRLGAGDKLQIDVFNQPDLTGNYTLDGNGNFSMHLIGTVEAGGLTAAELEQTLIDKLKPDYLVNPRVSVQVQSYRPYYLIGEVQQTGSFAYVDGMTYMTAVAIAGGFTYRAKKDHVFVIRADDPDREELKLDISEKVRPGDIIRVPERMF